MTTACAGFLEPRGSELGLLKSTFNAKNFVCTAGCLGLSLAIWAKFTFELRVAAQNHEKFTKTLYFGGLGHSRSSMLTLLRSSSLVLVIISSMSVPIFNHFHARQAKNVRITPF